MALPSITTIGWLSILILVFFLLGIPIFARRHMALGSIAKTESIADAVKELALGVCAFAVLILFFALLDGFTYADILLIRRDWVETKVNNVEAADLNRSTRRYYFQYDVGGQQFSAMCFYQRNREAQWACVYDRYQPSVAVLRGGTRYRHGPIGSLVLFLLLMAVGYVCSLKIWQIIFTLAARRRLFA